jgi:biotin transport system substrate-specific component
VFAPSELLWALIGLILTIGSTWLEAFGFAIPAAGLQREGGGLDWQSLGAPLGVSFQVGAVLFTGCMGGKNAAALSQIAYVILGVLLFERFGFQVFNEGAGFGYLREPSFGYLLGFIPAGWLCGKLAFQSRLTSKAASKSASKSLLSKSTAQPTLERLALATLSGVVVVHACGLSYLLLSYLFRWTKTDLSLLAAIMDYSVEQILGQVMVACAIALIAYGMRRALFY